MGQNHKPVQTEVETPEAAHVTHARQLLRAGLTAHHPHIALACSFSIEDVVVIDLLAAAEPTARVFALDTGRLPEETYRCADRLRQRYPGLVLTWYFPQAPAVQRLLDEGGPFSFRNSLEERHACCAVRKVEPLQRALAGLDAWITGMRRDQGVTRATLAEVETDALHGGILKYNPLAAWSAEQVWDYARTRRLPIHELYEQGYRSIGCAPCTRAVQPGEDDRAGRWWWERPEHKECGLHARNAGGNDRRDKGEGEE